jgi:non-ribosomal peptide synthetase component E (peptide arylation enzyme)
MPDPSLGERACAFVVLRAGRGLTLTEVAGHLAAAGLARYKTPERLVVVDALPRLESGKLRKEELRAQLAAGAARVR